MVKCWECVGIIYAVWMRIFQFLRFLTWKSAMSLRFLVKKFKISWKNGNLFVSFLRIFVETYTRHVCVDKLIDVLLCLCLALLRSGRPSAALATACLHWKTLDFYGFLINRHFDCWKIVLFLIFLYCCHGNEIISLISMDFWSIYIYIFIYMTPVDYYLPYWLSWPFGPCFAIIILTV